MHDLAFADAVRPTPVRILRLALRPYSLGHEALLLAERNPLLLADPAAFGQLPLATQIFALKRAVLLCSQTWAQNHAPQHWLRLWGWLTRRADYPLAIADFRNYLAAGRWLPPPPGPAALDFLYARQDEQEKGRALGSPMLAQLYHWTADNLALFTPNHQRSTLNLCPWDISYSLAGTLYFAALETEGRCRIENQLDHQTQQEWEANLSEIAAVKNEKCPMGNAQSPSPA